MVGLISSSCHPFLQRIRQPKLSPTRSLLLPLPYPLCTLASRPPPSPEAELIPTPLQLSPCPCLLHPALRPEKQKLKASPNAYNLSSLGSQFRCHPSRFLTFSMPCA